MAGLRRVALLLMSREPSGPMDAAHALRQAILARSDGFPTRMALIARYVLAHPDAVALGSVASIASEAQVAPSSLVRFGQALGLTGFAELQQVFRNELLERATAGKRLHPAATRYNHIVHRVVGLHKEALETLVDSLSEERLGQVVEMMRRAETIFIVAEGRSYPIGVVLRYMLGERQVRSCLATRDESAVEDILSFVGRNDVIIEIDIWPSLISVQSNLRVRPIRSAEPADDPSSHLTWAADSWLSIPVSEGAETSAIALCQTLAECLGQRGRCDAL